MRAYGFYEHNHDNDENIEDEIPVPQTYAPPKVSQPCHGEQYVSIHDDCEEPEFWWKQNGSTHIILPPGEDSLSLIAVMQSRGTVWIPNQAQWAGHDEDMPVELVKRMWENNPE